MQTSRSTDSLTVLVVDDMESIRGVIVALLREFGIEHVVQANDGYNAWKILTSQHIDIIISDLDMPKINGLELLKKIRGSIKHKSTPFLLLTASKEVESVKSAASAGVDQYLVKPFMPKQLKLRLTKLIEKLEQQ